MTCEHNAIFSHMILEAAGDEEIIGIVLGEYDGRDHSLPAQCQDAPLGVVLDWATAKPFLDYGLFVSLGGDPCHKVTAWTANKVIAIEEYDGLKTVFTLPRYPIAHKATFAGSEW